MVRNVCVSVIVVFRFGQPGLGMQELRSIDLKRGGGIRLVMSLFVIILGRWLDRSGGM